MRIFLILLFAAAAQAEFLDLRIALQFTECVSCAESLEGRLARVRGVETVELDMEASSVHLVLAPGNKVRMGPLEARITQDGTKIVSIEAVCRGAIVEIDGAAALQPTGLTQSFRLVGGEAPPIGAAGIATGHIDQNSFVLKQWQAESDVR